MFLDFLDTKDGRKISKLARESCTYNAKYEYWRDALFERIMRLFIWEGTDKVPPKEIEQRILLAGHCGVTKLDGELTAMWGNFFGVTKYMDEWKNYTVRCPIYSGVRTVGKDVVIINNNMLRNPAYPLVHHYATMLAHAEVSLIDALINVRDAGGIPVAATEKQKQSIAEYQAGIFNGVYGVVTDPGNLGINFIGSDRKTAQSVQDIYIIREKLLRSFYSDIGIRSAFEKRSNSIEAEVEADTSLLLLNLSDMLDCREKACEEINDMFGVNWSVHIAEEIDYGSENERIQFDTATEIHNVNDMEGGNNNVSNK